MWTRPAARLLQNTAIDEHLQADMTVDVLEVVAFDKLSVNRCENPLILAAGVRAGRTVHTSMREDRS